MEYKILAPTFNKNGYTYFQVWREGKYCIYKQFKEGITKDHWEAAEISSHDGYEIGGVKIPPSEVYPNNEAFGVKAFTCMSLEEAYKRIDYMKNHSADISLKNKEVDVITGKKLNKPSLKLPIVEFCVKDLVLLNPNIKPHNFYPAIQKLLKSGNIKETKRVSGGKGKATIFYEKI